MKTNSIKIKVYKLSNIAEMLLVNEETVRKFIKKGEMKAVYQGSKKEGYLILGTQLQEFLDKHKKYNKPYNTCLKAYGDPVKETTLKEFISEFLYGIIPYKDYKRITSMDTIFGTKFSLMMAHLKEIVDENKYNTLKNIVTICSDEERRKKDYNKEYEGESQ